MVWFGLALVVAIIIGIYGHNTYAGFIQCFLVSLFCGCIVAFFICIIIRQAIPDTYETIYSAKLIQTNDNYDVKVMALNNRNANDLTYVFTAQYANGEVSTIKKNNSGFSSENHLLIVETDKIEPLYVRQKARPIMKDWWMICINLAPSEYTIYVPKDKILYDYNIK